MPALTEIEGRFQYSIERFDGGLNTKDAPSKIGPYESPDCLNVVFDSAGSVWCRDGSKIFNTVTIGTGAIDHGTSYNNTMVVFANGGMFYASGTTMVPVTAASGKFSTGVMVATTQYQNVLFASDGSHGPWKWTGGQSFYNMGIDIPSAPTGASSGGGSISTGTYYYGVSFVNTQVVEGQIGSISAAATTTNSSTINVTQIPVGSSLAGVNQRFIYRADAASGPFRLIGTLNDNTTTSFSDTVANGAEGKFPIFDGTKPTPFTTVESFKERLWFDDSSNRSLIRFTNFLNPYISEVENFEPFDNGDGEFIQAISGQDDFLTVFKSNKASSVFIPDSSDSTTWVKRIIAANLGIVGPKALAKIQDGLVFVGKQNNRITGFHFLTGLNVIDTNDGKLRSVSISQKIEYNILNNLNSSQWTNMVCCFYSNRLLTSYASTGQTANDQIFWLDLTRVGSEGQPGSWAPWNGINSRTMFVNGGLLYSGDSGTTGFVRQLNAGQYSDSGAAINSYFWTKEIGGEEDGTLDGYIKDLRELYLWYGQLGNYNMNIKYRVDGDTGAGNSYVLNLNPGGQVWGTMIWGRNPWGGSRSDFQVRIVVGRIQGRRFQFRFDNQNALNQGFKVHRLEASMNLRRRR